MHTDSDTAVDIFTSVDYEVNYRRSLRHGVDGGGWLTRGRPGEAVADDLDQASTSDGSMLPPPYSSHFGERHGAVLSQTLLSNNTLTIVSRTGVPRTLAEVKETSRLKSPGRAMTRDERGRGFEKG